MLELQEIEKFYTELQEDINTQLISEEDGSTPEQIFTHYALTLLEEAGETENFRICYDEKTSKRGIEHKINGYALYENYETLDLFVTIYTSDKIITQIQKNELEKALNRAINFFDNAIKKNYSSQIEETSEIFDLANTLSKAPEVKEFLSRINVFILTNGETKLSVKPITKYSDYKILFRIIDIHYLFNLSNKSRIPIEINFNETGLPLPCISTNVELKGYQSYLAIIPGVILASIYEQYGLRLLEQNIRSFLQFSGKINRGIRDTILNEPHMFLAFNNGISATADEVTFDTLPNTAGYVITHVKNFQIVNGGQTIAAIYHTWKKYKADISDVYVQLKLTTIRDKENLDATVGRIAEYANTQNRISASDLSSNKPGLIKLEMISRSAWGPPLDGDSHQTRWFFERARGQFRNERLRQGFTPSKRKAFDLKNPRKQLLTKELFAKYVNSYQEIFKGNKIIIGPHFVVRGGQKNYAQFLRYNFKDDPDEEYFQDSVAKTIIFKTAEKVYGTKPNSIGDMRYLTVPYSVAWINYKLKYKIDLYKIWREQKLDSAFEDLLHQLMVIVEEYIKNNAPGALYGEWAKKEECWVSFKNQNFDVELNKIKHYLINEKTIKRKSISRDETDNKLKEEILENIKSLGADNWKKIYLYCKNSGQISQFYTDMAHNIGKKLRDARSLSQKEIYSAHFLLEEIAKKSNVLQSIYKDNYDK
ncbi:MAG: AIPR family protein [Spirochaetes bacterium]|nr:AIPR family protein [Spirochaetota bacterium]